MLVESRMLLYKLDGEGQEQIPAKMDGRLTGLNFTKTRKF
jgi:hypothetical protein